MVTKPIKGIHSDVSMLLMNLTLITNNKRCIEYVLDDPVADHTLET